MSGPKIFRAKVTNTQLEQIFQLQTDISLLYDQ